MMPIENKQNQLQHCFIYKLFKIMRKTLLYLVFSFFLTYAQAQIPPQTKIDSMLVNIDKSMFASEVLYDRAVPFATLGTFNDSIKLSSTSHFEQALLELYKASNEEKFMSHHRLRENYTDKNIQNKVDIGIINASFHQLFYIEENEEDGALRVVNDEFEKIDNGKPAFLERHAFVVSPLKEYLVGSQITYHFDNFFFMEATEGKDLVRLTANFGTDADYVVFDNGDFLLENVQMNYGEPGYKTLTFDAVFADNTTLTTQALLHVKLAAPPPTSNFPTDDFTTNATIPFNGIYGHLEYRIFYGNAQGQLLKPVVVIDGFDPQDERQIQDSDSNLPEDDHNSIEEMMVYFVGITKFEIIDQLTNLGYDVVIVNHPTYTRGATEIDGGADYIERNALTHVQLYQELNAELATNNSDEGLVIIGPSMGGQISRYALAYMEKHNIPHNTRLWVSVDSPHLGANIPLGLQTLVNQVADSGNSQAEDFVNNQLGSVAAKQQLIEQFNGWNGNQLWQDYFDGRAVSQGYATTRGRDFYITYYNNLFNNGLPDSKGYPQNLRKIALVNGSLNGSDIYKYGQVEQLENDYVNDEQIGVNLRAFTEVCLPLPCFDVHVGSLEAYAVPAYNENSKISRFLKGFSNKTKYATNLNSRGNMDNVPGGFFNSFDILAGSSTQNQEYGGIFWTFNGLGFILSVIFDQNTELSVYDNERVHSFIPTASALGFNDPDFNWNQAFDRNLLCSQEIPFDTYFGPRNNEQHTSFTQASVSWLLAEMAGNPQPPTIHLGAGDLSGPVMICGTDTVTYNFAPCKSLPVVEWVISGTLQLVPPATSSSYQVTVMPDSPSSNGWGSIKAIFASPNQPVIKNIWVGPPKVESVETVTIMETGHDAPIAPISDC